MQNYYPSLSASLAEQHRDDLCHQAEQARLVRGGRAARRPRWHAGYRWWRLAARATSA